MNIILLCLTFAVIILTVRLIGNINDLLNDTINIITMYKLLGTYQEE